MALTVILTPTIIAQIVGVAGKIDVNACRKVLEQIDIRIKPDVLTVIVFLLSS